MVDALTQRGDEATRYSCDKLRGGAEQPLIRRSPNGDEPCPLKRAIPMQIGKRTPGSETSQYQEENRTIVIPRVVASEKGRAQTDFFARLNRGCKRQ